MTTQPCMIDTFPGTIIFQAAIINDLINTIETGTLQEAADAIKNLKVQMETVSEMAVKAAREVDKKLGRPADVHD